MRLKNKIALITGGAQGIGMAIAELFIKEGASVILTDLNDQLGKDTEKKIKKNINYFHLDVAKEQDWILVTNFIKKKYQKLDILVNNAGIIGINSSLGPQDPEFTSYKSWKKIVDVNLNGVFLGCKYAIKLMRDNNASSIINIASRSGIVGVPGASAYAASKAGVRNHTRSVALYCAQQGYKIRCNAISPGAILTELWQPMLGGSEQEIEKNIKNIADSIPLKTMGEPKDVAYAALYFASEESKYVTGTELIVDGGILAGSCAAPAQSK